jgi:Fungal Zn(2)-Cys(6) binuclear cluster domain
VSDEQYQMAAAVVFGPAAPPTPPVGRLSFSSSSPSASASSSESPNTTTTFNFSVTFSNDSSPPSPTDDVIPKVEEIEEEDGPTIDPKVEPIAHEGDGTTDGDALPAGGAVRRPRGRPRKYPQTTAKAIAKPPKGRSKTGCITCRRRKKKCDETKPACLHCQKNNVHCEGYPPKDYWKPGKQNKKDRRLSIIERPRDLPQLIPAVETEVDWFFFEHFNMHLSRVLSLFTDRQNPFKGALRTSRDGAISLYS